MFSRARTPKPLVNRILRRSYHPTVLPSLISTSSPEFIAKKEAMDGLINEFEAKTAQARSGGGPKAQERMKSRGKLLPRERYVQMTVQERVRSAGLIIRVTQARPSTRPAYPILGALITCCS